MVSLHTSILFALAATGAAVWPPPRSIATSGNKLPLSPDFTIVAPETNSARLSMAIDRYHSLIVPAGRSSGVGASSEPTLDSLVISIASGASEDLNIDTPYDYTLVVNGTNAMITASSTYGAMYGLETFTQLVDVEVGALRYSSVTVDDAPDYPWRGLLVDTGRRFFPMDTLKNIIDTMAAVKLNVLHFHAADYCRFSVESKLYPNLTASLTGVTAGFYTQDDIKELVAYAGDRGMRVVPEFDVPGHSRGLLPLEGESGLTFCDPTDPHRTLISGTNETYNVIHALLGEMAALFPDEVFNIGMDETTPAGACTQDELTTFEQKLLLAVENDFNKTSEGWEEVVFKSKSATKNTIAEAWGQNTAAQITGAGYKSLEAHSGAFYFTAPGSGPDGWKRCWYDIATNIATSSQKALLLGGEMSMWTDPYCYINQCGGAGDNNPAPGAALFGPERDAEFGKSVGGMIWPRGYVGAAAFWHYNSSVDPTAPDFVSKIWALNDELAARGSSVCKSQCECNVLSQCGTPYIAP